MFGAPVLYHTPQGTKQSWGLWLHGAESLLWEGNINLRTSAILPYMKEKKTGSYENLTRGPSLEDSTRFPWGDY